MRVGARGTRRVLQLAGSAVALMLLGSGAAAQSKAEPLECPAILQEYALLSATDNCPLGSPITNDTIAEMERCIAEIDRRNREILQQNQLVYQCRLKIQKAEAENMRAVRPPVTYSPSYDCNLASNATEYAICGSENLSAQDRNMSEAYTQLRDRSPTPDTVRQRQREWLGERNSCGSEVGCIGGSYEDRLGEISDEMDMVANDEMHQSQGTTYSDPQQVFSEPEPENTEGWQETDSDSATGTSDLYCTDVPAIADELYNRSCTRGEDCYYSIVDRFGISCIP